MSDKKCKVCGDSAEWEFNGEWYCEYCMRTKFNVTWLAAPRICEMCGDPLDDVFYTDDEGNPFCSVKCALEYNGACELEEKKDND